MIENMKSENKNTRFTFRVESEILEKYKKAVGGNVSADLRGYMVRRIQSIPLFELKQKRMEKIRQINLLTIEIEELDNKINEVGERNDMAEKIDNTVEQDYNVDYISLRRDLGEF